MELDQIETQIDLMSNLNNIFLQSGALLDQLGTIVNTPRQQSMDDPTYRAYIMSSEASRFTGGTVNELIGIGTVVAGADAEANFQPIIDGGGVISCIITGNIQSFISPVYVGKAIALVRAAGVEADFSSTFILLSNTVTLYTCVTGLLDATGKLDAKTFLNPFISFNGYYVSVGIGGSVAPQPTDTGLTTEVLRKVATTKLLSNGETQFAMTLYSGDCNGDALNEVAMFSPSGDLILKYCFPAIQKEAGLSFTFTFQSNQNGV
jgi:hypothetical protein